MNFPRKLGLLLIFTSVVAAVSHAKSLALPSLRWFFSFSARPDQIREAEAGSWLGIPINWPWLREYQGELVGYGWCALLLVVGIVFLIRSRDFHWNPLTLRKFERFRSVGRGYASLKLLMFLVILTLLDQTLVGKRALAIHHEGQWCFPAFEQRTYFDRDFGGEGEDEANYRELKKRWAESSPESRVILPPVPWDSSFDSDEEKRVPLALVEGVLREVDSKKPYMGYAVCFQDAESDKRVMAGRVRQGLLSGPVQIFDAEGEMVGREDWSNGKRVSEFVEGAADATKGHWCQVIYMPLPPDWERKHFLGTDSKGWDILAQLYGGMQVLFKAAVLYLLLTYFTGIVLGSLMGYFGGVFDLFMQRIMEIMSNVPFLLVVMIIVSRLGSDKVTLGTVLLVFCIFSWISVATYLRTTTYKEKARDYVSAARVLGAPTSRIIFRHILPNVIATLVTLVPFSMTSVISSLTALDFLGFGLPERYPSWGRMLSDGISNLSSPWIVSSVFVMLVLVLLLVTFVGEAIREAFDPRKFTTYQ